MKKKIGEVLFQIIPVMIGVYLGFVISNWGDSKKRKAQSEILIENILSEVESNRLRIEDVIDYHKMLRDSSRYYSDTENQIDKLQFLKGSRVMTLASSAYNTGAQTGIINELPISIIQSLNQLYTTQEAYNEYGKMMMSGLIRQEFTDQESDMRRIARYLSLTMTDVVIQENNLLEGYKMINDKLKAK